MTNAKAGDGFGHLGRNGEEPEEEKHLPALGRKSGCVAVGASLPLKDSKQEKDEREGGSEGERGGKETQVHRRLGPSGAPGKDTP